jgi:hypothetical protein
LLNRPKPTQACRVDRRRIARVDGPGGGGSKEDENYWLERESGG